jgi:hypothetical protein
LRQGTQLCQPCIRHARAIQVEEDQRAKMTKVLKPGVTRAGSLQVQSDRGTCSVNELAQDVRAGDFFKMHRHTNPTRKRGRGGYTLPPSLARPG